MKAWFKVLMKAWCNRNRLLVQVQVLVQKETSSGAGWTWDPRREASPTRGGGVPRSVRPRRRHWRRQEVAHKPEEGPPDEAMALGQANTGGFSDILPQEQEGSTLGARIPVYQKGKEQEVLPPPPSGGSGRRRKVHGRKGWVLRWLQARRPFPTRYLPCRVQPPSPCGAGYG